jgi:hypothetical protein
LFAAFCADPDEVEVRCLLVMCVFVSSPLVAVAHGSRGRGQELGRALEELLR